MANAAGASLIVDGVVRIRVRGYGWAGDELMVEFDRLAPNIVGLPIVLQDGAVSVHAVVKEERQQDGRTLVICAVLEERAGERGAVG